MISLQIKLVANHNNQKFQLKMHNYIVDFYCSYAL